MRFFYFLHLNKSLLVFLIVGLLSPSVRAVFCGYALAYRGSIALDVSNLFGERLDQARKTFTSLSEARLFLLPFLMRSEVRWRPLVEEGTLDAEWPHLAKAIWWA